MGVDSLGGPPEEAIAPNDRERIADREQHEARLGGIVDALRSGRYFREGEVTTASFPERITAGEGWNRKDGSWPTGMGNAVAKYETTSYANPAPDEERDGRYGKTDHFEKELIAAGYQVIVQYDFDNSSADFDKTDYYIYQAAE